MYDLSTRSWPMILVTEYLEAHPLGRAEWMVPLAWMMGDSSAGAQAFAGVRDRYEALVGQRMEGAKAPKVLMGSVADGVWHAPGQNTFVARWVEDAGGQYALTAEDHDSNVALGLEQVLEHAAQCDLWMMVVHDPDSFTVSDLLAQDPKHQALLEATDEVWVCNTAKHDYFGALVQPDLILEDLRSAMQLGQVGPHGTFQPLSPLNLRPPMASTLACTLLVCLAFLHLRWGEVPMDAFEWWAALLGTGEPSPLHATILWEVRMSRMLTAVSAGVLLGWLGMLLQTWFGIPLRDQGCSASRLAGPWGWRWRCLQV